MTILTEGLKEHDLMDLVLPMISVDEYESKLDEDAIVIGFFVQDHDPAQDLNRFIQKSAISLLDTDVSPAPNEDGYFLVFVEFMRDESVINKVITMVENLEGLTDLEPSRWKFKPYGHKGVFDLNKKNLHILVRLEPIEDVLARAEEDKLHEFFQPSCLDDLVVENNTITVTRRGLQHELIRVAFGPEEVVCETVNLLNQPFRIDEAAVRDCRWWQSLLGEGWSVNAIGQYRLITHVDSKEVLVTK